MNKTYDWKSYKFWIVDDEFEKNVLHIRVIDSSMRHDFPVFHLKLKPLWVRAIEGFANGDYYQDTMNKENMVEVNTKISYAALTHDFLLANAASFSFIKRIFSSSLKGHPDEAWTPSMQSRNFWSKQLNKNLGVIFDGDRYCIKIND